MDTSWPAMMNATVIATELPTCNQEACVYFSRDMVQAVVGIQRLDDTATSPHHPSRLRLRGDGRRHAVRTFKKPLKLEPLLPHGPPSKPPDYTVVDSTICKHEGLNRAMTGGRCWRGKSG